MIISIIFYYAKMKQRTINITVKTRKHTVTMLKFLKIKLTLYQYRML